MLLPLLLLALTGCALVPTGGPVQTGRQVQEGSSIDDPYVRVLPTGPKPGWSPEQMVRHFLAASGSFADNHGVAREYLAREVRAQWEPDSSVEVYEDGSAFQLLAKQRSAKDAVITVMAEHVATIDGRGQYIAAPPGDTLHVKFRLRRLGGQWRIVSFPSGLLLTPRVIDRVYRTVNLYFFSPRYEVVVPNLVYVPAGLPDQLPTRLTRALLRGATDWLAPAVRTAFPDGTGLDGNVQVREGIATVALGGTAASADDEALAYMSAQLAWTLGALPEVDGVRLRVAGETFSVPGAGEVVNSDSWASLDPGGTAGAVHGYMVRGGRLLVTTQNEPQPAPGPAGSPGASVHDPAVSLRDDRAAWIAGNGGELIVGQLREGGDSGVRLTGKGLHSPSWDRFGNLWVVGDGGEQDKQNKKNKKAKKDWSSHLWVLQDGTDPMRVDMPEPEGGPFGEIHAFRVARGGARVALITGSGRDSRLLIGRIERGEGGPRIDGLIPLPTTLTEVVDVAWRNADRLAVLGRDARGVYVPYLVEVDGTSPPDPTGPLDDRMVSIAAAPNAPLLVELQNEEVWRSADYLAWEPLTDGRDPVYPG